MKLYQYRLHCVTESADVLTNYVESTLPVPTTCPNNTAHTVDQNSTIILNTLDSPLQMDSDGATFSRAKQAPVGWTYQMRAVEFKTSVLGSTVNQDVNGTPLSDSTLRLYDAAGVEITDPTLQGTAVKTVFDLEPPFDYYIIGGICKVLETPTSNVFISVIAVPDVPFSYGGSRVMVQSVNLKYITPSDKIDADGRASKGLVYSPNHTTKLRFIVLHGAGVQVQLAAFLEMYKV